MAFSLERFMELRPYLYHSTSQSNFERLRKEQVLISATALCDHSGMKEIMRDKRITKMILSSGYVLQSQRPLQENNIEFECGWKIERLLKELNELVFFWPGREDGPIKNGRNHFISQDGPRDANGAIVLRVPTRDAFEQSTPLFCRYNSGSPRCSGGKKSPRGPGTFVSEQDFTGTPSEVVEVVFRHTLQLPATTEYSYVPEGPWSVGCLKSIECGEV